VISAAVKAFHGRVLGLPEAKQDHIAQKHPNDPEEQVVELLKEWRKMQKAEAKTDTLIKALRSCDQYTADLIQTELEKLYFPRHSFHFTLNLRHKTQNFVRNIILSKKDYF
uniref:Death domain-containing protein n=1 Tax=Oncorhynchus tshawytscha TaxID=74940 RepID=A0AAZ3PTZ4_ONCTS